jgi:tRNA(Ile)-lysidine synthase
MNFSVDYLLKQLRRQPAAACYWVAFSGGMDSHVLLHALYQLREVLDAAIGAVHVNHGLQAAADDWVTHCQQVCAALNVPFVSLQADGSALRGDLGILNVKMSEFRQALQMLQADIADFRAGDMESYQI